MIQALRLTLAAFPRLSRDHPTYPRRPGAPMNCPICDASTSRVLVTRQDTIESKLRQRKCASCGIKWWTCEVELPLGAVKWADPETADLRRFPVPRRVAGFRRITFS
jgi:hypothetical protein